VQEGAWEKAAKDFTTAIDLCPSNAEVYLMRAGCYGFPGALSDLNTYIDMLPACASGYEHRAWILTGKQDYSGALSDANRVVQIRPDSVSYTLRGSLYVQNAEYDKALVDLNTAMELDSNNIEAVRWRSSLWWAKENWPNAISDLNRAIQLMPKDSTVYNSRALVFIRMKLYDKAWEDVYTIRRLGGKVDDGLLNMLRRESARDE
jgi:tetratricopeptide (TPR) repeat protein